MYIAEGVAGEGGQNMGRDATKRWLHNKKLIKIIKRCIMEDVAYELLHLLHTHCNVYPGVATMVGYSPIPNG
jgi:hypothetical protein